MPPASSALAVGTASSACSMTATGIIPALPKRSMISLGADSPFCRLDNVVLTDHTAYSTAEGVEELKRKAAQNVIDVLREMESSSSSATFRTLSARSSSAET
mgnify:CR=1 FL=1